MRAILALFIAAVGLGAATSEDLFRAVRNDDLAFLKKHVSAENVNARDAQKSTLLMHAAAFGTREALELLLQAGADLNAKNVFDSTALIWATGDPVKARMLVERGAGVNAQSKLGRTPLILAARRDGAAELVRLLLSKGADVRAADTQKFTALTGASETGDPETMRILIDKGADVNAADWEGFSPLMYAVMSNNLEAVRLLLAKGANVNAANTSGGTVKNGKIALIKLTPLMLAAPFGSAEMVRTLLQAGADVNAKDIRNMTPLMLAVSSENQDVAVLHALLAAGADINIKSTVGETTLDWARKFGNPAVIGALEKAGAKAGVPFASPPRPQSNASRDAASRVEASIALLQRTSTQFFKEGGCVGCHHQPVTAMAVRAARSSGIRIDETIAREQRDTMKFQWASRREQCLQDIDPGGATDQLVYSLFGLWAAGHEPDGTTDGLVAQVAAAQRRDGSWWLGGISRSPIEESRIARTALALRGLQLYAYPARKTEFDQRVARARAFLLEAKPRTTDEHAMRLLGLGWSGAEKERIRGAARGLIALQHADGGWSGNAHLQSDAYSTGETLYALHETGSTSVNDAVYQRGVKYLLATQYEDGSWYVRSRAPKFQPYFQSGFPFEHDQWISATATAWAAIALAPAVERGRAVAQR